MPKPDNPPGGGKPDKPPGKPTKPPVDPPTEPPIEPPVEGRQPELPRVYVDTTLVPPTGVTIHIAAGASLQFALDSAQPGDLIELERGATFEGRYILPAKEGAAYITVQTEGFNEPGRISPSLGLSKLFSPTNEPVITAANGSHHYRFIGIETAAPNQYVDTLIALGDSALTRVADQPHHIILDRFYIHGDSIVGGKRGVGLQGSHQAVIDCYLSDWKGNGQDTQALCGWNGTGPFKIANNYIEGAGENVLFGGADTRVNGLVPSDIEIVGNHFFKPLTWRGTQWLVKNLFELKNAQRLLAHSNLFENCWAHGQVGFAIVFTVRNQQGSNPWATVRDVTFTANKIRNAANGFNLLGIDNEHPSASCKRLLVANNLLTEIGGQSDGSDGILFQILSGYEDITVDHNTALHTGSTIVAEGAPSPRMWFTNTIAQHNLYGVFGGGVGSGNACLDQYFPESVFTHNVLATPTEPPVEPYYPPDNYFPATLGEIGFVDYPDNLHLAPTSPYAGAGTDEKDIGY